MVRACAEILDASPETAGVPILLELPAGPIEAAVTAGSVLIDGRGEGLLVEASAGASAPARSFPGPDGPIPVSPVGLAYAILQGCRLRLTRAEFIACPSCGRTQFDLQTTTKRIQESTAHLRGVKIAIMGCIVNGPGEMADADFGYVGSAPGKVDLYVGKSRVKQAVPAEEACRRLIELIREHGQWIDPPAEGA
jgi:(E)-4-hydroxy-3-methylbut-2-enyl-diphosphate synthase